MDKITKKEKEELIIRRIEMIDKNRNYAIKLFKLYYEDNPAKNYSEWLEMDEKGKRKIIAQIQKWEDKAFVNQAFTQYKNPINALNYINELKAQQLKEFNIR